VLLDRYGVIFRELIAREVTAFTWRELFQSLRLMELSGEVIAAISSQGSWVCSSHLLRRCAASNKRCRTPRSGSMRRTRFLPASSGSRTCARASQGASRQPPGLCQQQTRADIRTKRQDIDNPLGCRRSRLADTSRPAPTAGQPQLLPQRQIIVESINGIEAERSPYLDVLRTLFNVVVDYKSVYLQRRL